ncbi:MAG: hypothetical protein IPF69_06660 [Chitinophagaceae bacterium]|nr:hypothetical protein [Chitinophagaceae bacterium]
MSIFSEVSNELIDEMKTEFKKGDTDEGATLRYKKTWRKFFTTAKSRCYCKRNVATLSSGTGKKNQLILINWQINIYDYISWFAGKRQIIQRYDETDFDETIGNINIIPQDIGRVILNLINNAFMWLMKRKNMLRQAQQDSPTNQLFQYQKK